jgi:hypothetical protein
MRRRSGLVSAISLLLFSRLRFNSSNHSKQKPHPQIVPANAASAASFNQLASSGAANPPKNDVYASPRSVISRS